MIAFRMGNNLVFTNGTQQLSSEIVQASRRIRAFILELKHHKEFECCCLLKRYPDKDLPQVFA